MYGKENIREGGAKRSDPEMSTTAVFRSVFPIGRTEEGKTKNKGLDDFHITFVMYLFE
jgi:hypothetical protein